MKCAKTAVKGPKLVVAKKTGINSYPDATVQAMPVATTGTVSISRADGSALPSYIHDAHEDNDTMNADYLVLDESNVPRIV